jgi:hypothetical protein
MDEVRWGQIDVFGPAVHCLVQDSRVPSIPLLLQILQASCCTTQPYILPNPFDCAQFHPQIRSDLLRFRHPIALTGIDQRLRFLPLLPFFASSMFCHVTGGSTIVPYTEQISVVFIMPILHCLGDSSTNVRLLQLKPSTRNLPTSWTAHYLSQLCWQSCLNSNNHDGFFACNGIFDCSPFCTIVRLWMLSRKVRARFRRTEGLTCVNIGMVV